MECARDCCKVPIHVHIGVNSPLSYTWCVDSYIFELFSFSIRFIFVCSCEILRRTEQWLYYFRTFNHAQLIYFFFYAFDPPTKKNGHEFQSFYIRPHSGVDSGQWDWGIIDRIDVISYIDLIFDRNEILPTFCLFLKKLLNFL